VSAISFMLLCEGSSDQPLVQHLQTLLVRNGASSAVGTADYRKGTVPEKLRRCLAENEALDLVFVHRDADGRSPEARIAEVMRGAASVNLPVPCIPLVPISMTEAWLLVDESAIREVVGRPQGRADLGIPPVRRIETTADPKSVLKAALGRASEKTGRRLREEQRQFYSRRRVLLQRLNPDGAVRQLSAWTALEADVAALALGDRR
jgi:hypothetical protein